MKKDNKIVKKIIVNGLTLTRVAGTISMPILFNSLSAPIFLLVIASILFTDCLDGILARHWGVSTIFGSLLDMGADKLFGISVLIVLSTMYPIMTIPLVLETIIAGVNIKALENNGIAKSSEIGRIKTWVMGLSTCLLLLTGLSPELRNSLENINILSINNNLLMKVNEVSKSFLDFINKNKQTIENIAATASITAESIVATDYTIKSIKSKNKNSNSYKIANLIKNKVFLEYAKKVMLDENYYKETKDMPILEKLCPPELREDVKKLKLEK